MSYHVEDKQLLMYLFELFGQLAFLHENLQVSFVQVY